MKSKITKQIIQEPTINNINSNIYQIRILKCSIDGNELSIKDIKTQLNADDTINELAIFGIPNRLYKDIVKFLTDEDIDHTIYGKSRIVIKR